MNAFHLCLAVMMVVCGSINTLSVKWADTMTSLSTDGKQRGFDHPFLQACGMFLGEMSCMLAFILVRYYRRRKQQQDPVSHPPLDEDPMTRPRNFNPLIFLPPAMCDMTATSTMYIGLTLTYASSFQMLRGSVIIFTGLWSRIFLGRRLQWFKWVGIVFVIIGLAVVGVCDMLYMNSNGGGGHNGTVLESEDAPFFHAEYFGNIIRGQKLGEDPSSKSPTEIIVGDILIVCAQVIVATQMVYEEKYITKYNVPALQAVGWEGTFGFLTLSALLIPMYFIPVGQSFGNNPRHVLEDAYDGLYQLAHNSWLLTAFCGTILSIAFFNFAGISVTKEMSATTRMVLDSVRTLVIWSVSLALGWQVFHPLQLLGFALLVVGMCVYNDIIIGPSIRSLMARLGVGVSAQDPYAGLENEPDESEDRSLYQPDPVTS